MLQDIIDMLSNYVKYNYIVKRIGVKLKIIHNSVFNFVNKCRYDMFDIPEEDVSIIEGNDSLKLGELYSKYTGLLDAQSTALFNSILLLSRDEKKELCDIIEYRMSIYVDKANLEYSRYTEVVELINERLGKSTKEDIYSLWLLSRELYSYYYEYRIVSEVYSNLYSYLSGYLMSSGKNK